MAEGAPRLTDNDFARRALIAAAIVAGLALAVFAAWSIMNLLLIFFGSVLFAIFVRAFADPLAARAKMAPTAAVAIVTIVLAALVVGAGFLIGRPLVDQIARVIDRMPETWFIVEYQLRQIEWLEGQGIFSRVREQAIAGMGQTIAWVSNAVTGLLTTIAYLAVALVVGLYLAFQPDIYRWGIANLAPPAERQHVLDVGTSLNELLRGWLLGQFAAMVFVGVLTGVGLWIIDFPMVIALAVIAFFLTFVPNIGPLATLVIAILIALMEAPDKVLHVSLLYIGVQILETYLFTPIVQRRTALIPPALLLACQLAIGALFGFLGLLVAAPLTVAGMVLVRRLYREDILGEPPRDDCGAASRARPGEGGQVSAPS